MSENRLHTDEILPIPTIPTGMLSSPQIYNCLKNGWLVIHLDKDKNNKLLQRCLSDDEIDNQLRSATYDMRMGNFAVRYDMGRKNEFIISDKFNEKNWISLPPNSLTFITTYEAFKLPRDVIARFNLKSKLVHKGLLLGTGPIVDPEFYGKVTIPIHNFSNQEVIINFKDSIIAVEFTRTLDASECSYVNNPNCEGNPRTYLSSAGLVESSVLRTVEELKKTNERQERFISMASIAIIIAIVALIYQGFSLMSATNSRIDGSISELNNLSEKINSQSIRMQIIEEQLKINNSIKR